MADAPRTPTPCSYLTVLGPAGAVGRSAVALNVAGLLAARGFRVLLVDADLEAPALSHLVDAPGAGLSELLLAALAGDAPADALPRRLVRPPLPGALAEPSGSLALLPAGGAAARLAEAAASGSRPALEAVFKDMVEETGLFDHVLLDSSSAGPGGALARGLAAALVVVSGLRPPELAAAARIVDDLAGDPRPLEVVLGPIPAGEDARVDARLEAARGALGRSRARVLGRDLAFDLELPYHPRLDLDLDLHVLRSGRGPLVDAYRRIEARLLGALGDTHEAAIERASDAAGDGRWAAARADLARARRLVGGATGWIDGFAGSYAAAEAPAEPDAIAELDALVLAGASPSALRAFARGLRRRADAEAEVGELDAAEALYHRALAAGPDDVVTLGKLAAFAQDAGREPDAVEALYRRAIAADPAHAVNLGNLANFLCDVRRDLDGAEAMYRRAIDADPENAANPGNYATFLVDERDDPTAAEAMYRRALEIDPDAPTHLANLGRLLLGLDRTGEGIDAATRALEGAGDEPSELDAECWMYLYCAAEARRGPALARLRALVVDHGIRTGAWDFSRVIDAARRRGHPESAWLPRLAEALAGAITTDALEGWAAWRDAVDVPSDMS
ncbi:MAG: hypothetical protein R3B09_00960 [Nannocystaceae bacterium]